MKMEYLKSLRLWAHALLAAAIGGATTTLSAAYALPDQINFTRDGLHAMEKIAAAGAFMAVLAYMKQSPIPDPDKCAEDAKK